MLSNGGGNEIKLIEIYKYLSCIFELEVEMEIRIFEVLSKNKNYENN